MARLPKMMRAAAIDRFGKPGVLSIHQLPLPEIGAGEVLIAVHTAGVGGWDADMRSGWWPGEKPRFPLVLGSDGAGKVAALGSRVRRLTLGEPVYAYSFANPKGGCYAEYLAVPAECAAAVPASQDLKHAGAVPTTGLTALQGIDDALRLRKGENLIIHGAGGGVGTLAVQFARLRGARILATAKGDDGIALVRRLGAHKAVSGEPDAIKAEARAFASEGVDAVLGLVGGAGLTQCLRSLRPGGRLAFPNGVEPVPRRREGIEITAYDAVAGLREFRQLARAIEAARLKVPIAAAYPLAEAAKAHERLAVGHVLGKIVLRIR
jgi:NADPH2:quinone reductase